MSVTIDCPHQQPGIRRCDVCVQRWRDGKGLCCDGEITSRVYQDSDGDAGVINGIRHFLAVEDLEASCGCTLTAHEEQKVIDQLCERYGEDDGLADMYEDEARREAGW